MGKRQNFGFYFAHFGVIALRHIRRFKGKNFTMLFVYFFRSFNNFDAAFIKSSLIIF